jgi:hypothetical protein
MKIHPKTGHEYEEPFEPHEWVVQAIIWAYNRGANEGYYVGAGR